MERPREQQSAESANADFCQQMSAKSAVNVNDNVNDNIIILESNKLDSSSTLQVDPVEVDNYKDFMDKLLRSSVQKANHLIPP